MLEKGKRPDISVTVRTFMVSAFWHGFYPFYYVMFFNAGLCLELAKEVFRNRDWFVWSWMPYYMKWFICNQLTMFQMNYLGVSFNQLTFERGYNMAKGTGFIVWIATPILLGVMKFISAMRGTGKSKKVEKKD
jgi:lysophospholipid acyltransferase